MSSMVTVKRKKYLTYLSPSPFGWRISIDWEILEKRLSVLDRETRETLVATGHWKSNNEIDAVLDTMGWKELSEPHIISAFEFLDHIRLIRWEGEQLSDDERNEFADALDWGMQFAHSYVVAHRPEERSQHMREIASRPRRPRLVHAAIQHFIQKNPEGSAEDILDALLCCEEDNIDVYRSDTDGNVCFEFHPLGDGYCPAPDAPLPMKEVKIETVKRYIREELAAINR